MLFAFTPDEITPCRNLPAYRRKLFSLLNGQYTVSEILVALHQAGHPCFEEQIITDLKVLYKKKLLEDYADDISGDNYDCAFGERYSRQALFFAAREENGIAAATKAMTILKNSHVVLFGMGGFGCHLLYEFAGCGIGKLTIVDYDRVQASNLNRQLLFREEDIGKNKIEIGRNICTSLNSDIEYHFIQQKISSWEEMAQIIEGSDCAVLAADSPRGRIFSWMNQAAYKCNVTTLFSLGVSAQNLRIGPMVVPGETACFDCSMPDIGITYDDPLSRSINKRHQHGVIAPYVMTAAGLMALELLKHLTNFAPCAVYNQRLDMDLLTYQTTMVPINRRPNCPFCS
jgi:molybdopterin/thiamine biosynthesis adenylyltransferase